YHLVPEETPVAPARVERVIPGQDGEARGRSGITPGGALGPLAGARDGGVGGRALPLAYGTSWLRNQKVEAHVVGWEVDARRMTGLEHPECPARAGHYHAGELDHGLPFGSFDTGWTGIVPRRLLARSRRHRHRSHLRASSAWISGRRHAIRAPAIPASART